MRNLILSVAPLMLFAMLSACGDAPPPPAKSTAPRNVRVHVSNATRFDICRVEACGQIAKPVDTGGEKADAKPLKPHEAGMYEVRACTGTLKAIACPTAENPNPCMKAEGGSVDDGTMFRVQPCAL